ncbi:MAG: hypothetical protein U0325_06875 [Polyangiales bacterium]
MRTLLACALLTAACADSASTASLGGPGSSEATRGVTQGGAQDIARFRAIVRQGEVPAPDTLSDTGFLAEHALDLPPATCGEAVCLNPMLAVAPRFDGGNWTMAWVALSTRVDPASRPRRPLHLIAVVEDSPAVLGDTDVQAELARLFGALPADDRVSLVQVGSRATVPLRGATPSVARGWRADATGSTDVALYEGIAAARGVARAVAGADARVLLLTSGRRGAGVDDDARVVALGESLAREGVAISVVGLGADFQARVPEALGSLGAGTYAYAEDRADLGDILQREAQTTLFPFATAFSLRLTPAAGYTVGRIYGARRATLKDGYVLLEAPALFVGARQGAQDVAGGRRGGGAGLYVELLANGALADRVGRGAPAFTAEAAWTDVATGETRRTRVEQRNGLAPGQNPPDSMWPEFSDEARGKAFMALNLYLALRASVGFYDAGDCARAQGVLDMMDTSVEVWRRRRPDPDIDADAALMQRLRENLRGSCRAIDPVQPRTFSGGCFFS